MCINVSPEVSSYVVLLFYRRTLGTNCKRPRDNFCSSSFEKKLSESHERRAFFFGFTPCLHKDLFFPAFAADVVLVASSHDSLY